MMAAVLVLVLVGLLGACTGANAGFEAVTYGSTLKLAHVLSNYRLHSHAVAYGRRGGGSGQQSVTVFPTEADSNSLWQVRGPALETPRTPGSVVKLRHTRISCAHVCVCVCVCLSVSVCLSVCVAFARSWFHCFSHCVVVAVHLETREQVPGELW